MTAEQAAPQRRAVWGVFGSIILVLIGVIVWLILGTEGRFIPDAGPVNAPTMESVLVITGPGEGDLPALSRPLGVVWGPRGDIYVSDTGGARVCVFDDRGRFLREVGRVATSAPPAQRATALVQPAGLAVSDDGTLYVADLRGGAVRVFDRAGKLTGSIRPPASKAGDAPEKWMPTDVALAPDEVYVADARGVAVFSAKGALQRRLDAVAPGVPFKRPYSVDVDPSGRVFVSDSLAQRVTALSAGGAPQWAAPSLEGGEVLFGLPRGVAGVGDGSALVCDAFKFGFTHLSAKGANLGTYAARGKRPAQFEYPNDLDVSGDLVLVADKENDRVQVVRLRGILDATTDAKDE